MEGVERVEEWKEEWEDARGERPRVHSQARRQGRGVSSGKQGK